MKILFIEDEEQLARFVRDILAYASHKVTWFPDLNEVLSGNYDWDCDMIILDLMLPGKPGYHLIDELKRLNISIPVLILSAKDDVDTKATMLNIGADDYLTKPFEARELLARINALSRRSIAADRQSEYVFEDMVFYRKQNLVERGGKKIFLTKKEGDLLNLLFQHKGQTLRTQDILRKIWHANAEFHSNIVQATIYRLRAKIDGGFKSKLIHCIHGIGYRLSATPDI
jgi:two-component system, OmpR family, copper resistance phosphate regulon response regulator CusR